MVEASAVYAITIECIVHKQLSLRRAIFRIPVECATLVGGFLIILGMARGFTNYLILAEIPMQVLDFVQTHVQSPFIFLLALNFLLVIVGGLLDIYSAIFVVVPLITPLAAAYGIDPVHLGIIFLANLELGYLTPPMGRESVPLRPQIQSASDHSLSFNGAVLVNPAGRCAAHYLRAGDELGGCRTLPAMIQTFRSCWG